MLKSHWLSALPLLSLLAGCSDDQGVPNLGQSGAPLVAAGWRTQDAAILAPGGSEFLIEGINWYGFETRNSVAHGLWALNYTTMLSQIAAYGFNTVRIPFSNEMWETNPVVRSSLVSGCSACKGKTARDVLALIINGAGALGLHVILDNHRSAAGNSAESNGLWYTAAYPESAWIADWRSIQAWVNGSTAYGARLDYLASDGAPIVLGFDLRNEPHTPASTSYLAGATWGSGDGVNPNLNPNPNPFSPSCVASSTCRDWRLAAERAGTTLMGDAAANGWPFLLMFVEGVGRFPKDGKVPADNVTDDGWWGGMLLGPRGNSTNPGAPVVFNQGGNASTLGPAVDQQLVYSAHDYGPDLSAQPWFNAGTCYAAGCGPASLSDVWYRQWAYLTDDVAPVWAGHASYPWANTGHTGYSKAPVFVGEFGTTNTDAALFSSGAGSQGQWFTAMINFIQHSRTGNAGNDPGVSVGPLHFAYWALNGNDNYALLNRDFNALEKPEKLNTFLCAIESDPPSSCNTGALPLPGGGSPPPPPPCSSDTECSDNDACSGIETCDIASGACLAGVPVICNDGDACTEDVCLSPAGVCGTTGANLCPVCGPNRASCNTGADCCSGNCKGGLCKGG